MQKDEVIAALQQYESELERILSRFQKTRDGIHIARGDDARFLAIAFELRDLFDDKFVDGRRHSQPLLADYNESISNFTGTPSYHGVECVKVLVSAAVSRVKRHPLALKTAALAAKAAGVKDSDTVVKLAERLHIVIRQLRHRREDRSTLDVVDEYDVQDLIHALLAIYFDDIRREEWSPTYAGGGSRMDFLLPEVEAVVEIKMTRSSLSTKQLGEQLIVDIAKYRQHPMCRRLFCIIYDPSARISNPRGVENDLGVREDRMDVCVMIVPR
ncbi:hypothetical protein ACVIGA_000644 [Bradyrhizobium sp. USDA 3240]